MKTFNAIGNGVAKRRSFLRSIGIAGTGLSASVVLGSESHAQASRRSTAKLPKGDAALLRLAAAVELIEGFSSELPLATTFISKNHRAVSTPVPSGESFAATTNLRRENQSPNLHKRRIATSEP
jgi:hypothetical protein